MLEFVLFPVVPTDCSDGRPSDTEELLGRHDYNAANEKDTCDEKQQQPNNAKNSAPSPERRQLNFEVSFINDDRKHNIFSVISSRVFHTVTFVGETSHRSLSVEASGSSKTVIFYHITRRTFPEHSYFPLQSFLAFTPAVNN
jgi:hypothetical protein